MGSGVSISKAIPVLEVADVGVSIQWYREMLGFSADPFPETPPHQFAILRHSQTELMLRCGSSKTLAEPRQYQWDVYLRLGGGQIRQLFAELTSRGVVYPVRAHACRERCPFVPCPVGGVAVA